MEKKLTREEMLEKMHEIKLVEVDCYGLSKTDRTSKENISQITEFDSFLFQDAIQLVGLSQEQIEQFKLEAEAKSKINPETKLYSVTIGDLGTSYYEYATMFNRLTNKIYAGKVNKSKDLLRQFARAINSQSKKETESIIGDHGMTEAFRRDEERRR